MNTAYDIRTVQAVHSASRLLSVTQFNENVDWTKVHEEALNSEGANIVCILLVVTLPDLSAHSDIEQTGTRESTVKLCT